MNDTSLTQPPHTEIQFELENPIVTKLKKVNSTNHPNSVMAQIEEVLKDPDVFTKPLEPNSIEYNALSIYEFDNHLLMSHSVPAMYYTFTTNHSLKLQEEYQCTTTSEKALCQTAAMSYARVLDIQRRLKNMLDVSAKTAGDRDYIRILDKGLDRANRQYYSAIQALRYLKQPQVKMNISVKTQNANIANQQIVNAAGVKINE